MSFELKYEDGRTERVDCPGWVSNETWAAEGWFTPDEAAAIVRAACSLGPTGNLVELGTWRGRSAAILADALGPGWFVHTIDNYPTSYVGQGEGHDPDRARESAGRLLDQRTNVVRWIGESHAPARLVPTDRMRAWCAPASGEVRVVFIDAEHSEDAVRRDLETWEPFVAPGGFIFLHDATDPRVGAAVVAGARRFFVDKAMLGDSKWRRRQELEAGSLLCYRNGP